MRTQQDWTPAEHAIYNAIQEVEKFGAHQKLTEVVILLGNARALISDFFGESEVPVVNEKSPE